VARVQGVVHGALCEVCAPNKTSSPLPSAAGENSLLPRTASTTNPTIAWWYSRRPAIRDAAKCTPSKYTRVSFNKVCRTYTGAKHKPTKGAVRSHKYCEAPLPSCSQGPLQTQTPTLHVGVSGPWQFPDDLQHVLDRVRAESIQQQVAHVVVQGWAGLLNTLTQEPDHAR
jgi:hypothetical protein